MVIKNALNTLLEDVPKPKARYSQKQELSSYPLLFEEILGNTYIIFYKNTPNHNQSFWHTLYYQNISENFGHTEVAS